MYKLYQKVIDLADGRQITIETGKLAKQADGAVTVRCGETIVIVAAAIAGASFHTAIIIG